MGSVTGWMDDLLRSPGLGPCLERRLAARRGQPRDAPGGLGAGGLPGGTGRRQGQQRHGGWLVNWGWLMLVSWWLVWSDPGGFHDGFSLVFGWLMRLMVEYLLFFVGTLFAISTLRNNLFLPTLTICSRWFKASLLFTCHFNHQIIGGWEAAMLVVLKHNLPVIKWVLGCVSGCPSRDRSPWDRSTIFNHQTNSKKTIVISCSTADASFRRAELYVSRL